MKKSEATIRDKAIFETKFQGALATLTSMSDEMMKSFKTVNALFRDPSDDFELSAVLDATIIGFKDRYLDELVSYDREIYETPETLYKLKKQAELKKQTELTFPPANLDVVQMTGKNSHLYATLCFKHQFVILPGKSGYEHKVVGIWVDEEVKPLTEEHIAYINSHYVD